MDKRHSSLSATNLAVHHHLNCDLYIHNVYHQHTQPITPAAPAGPCSNPVTEAQYRRGLDWETTLYSWLDSSNLLLKVPGSPLEADVLMENILADDRDRFFISGLTFVPPEAQLLERFQQAGTPPVNFGIGKPDLLEIVRSPDGITWKVIDAKASTAIKTSHHVQIYFYTLCLTYLLDSSFFRPSGEAGVWLPPDEGFNIASPSLDDIRCAQVSLLAPSLDRFLFERLPKLLALQRESVDWHFNPLCQGFGVKPFSLSDLGEAVPGPREKRETDFEAPSQKFKFEGSNNGQPHARRRENKDGPGTILVKLSKFYAEDIAIVLSLVQDPASPKPQVEFFTVSLFEHSATPTSRSYSGDGRRLVPTLAVILREFTSSREGGPTVQFYVWSSTEQSLLQGHLIQEALLGDANQADIRACIGALAQGASLLQTSFQPLVLSGALLAFLTKGRRVKAEYQACLERMGLPTRGTVPELRARVIQELERLQSIGPRDQYGQYEFGQIPRVVVLKKEIERMVALPVAGYWDLAECATVLLQGNQQDFSAPTDETILRALKADSSERREMLGETLTARNTVIDAVLATARDRVQSGGQNLLVNTARKLSTDFMDICRQEDLSKLFFMQQFEVLSKLNELWSSRKDGCPDAPVLQYQGMASGVRGVEHTFKVVSGTVDIPTSDKEMSFFDKLLAEDTSSEAEIPVEALFNDLAVSGLVVPLNRWTKANWELQHQKVQENVLLADIRNVYSANGRLTVSLRTWGTSSRQLLVLGHHYRLSQRLVDFNTTKVLSSLFEMDLLWESSENTTEGESMENDKDPRGVPFLQLLMDPKSFGRVPLAKECLKIEEATQKLFRNLRNLDVAAAGNLLLKTSQHRATQRLLANRLAALKSCLGTGKTHTIALSVLRLLEVQWKLEDREPRIIFITAMTHAAIDACQSKLERLIECYKSIDSLPKEWLEHVCIERILKGTDHPAPSKGKTHVYAGTLYQLYNFSKAHNIQVDAVIADEAGQIALASISLVLRNLTPTGRIIIAGDSEQLAPIFSGSYPRLKTSALFGSVLDCIMFSQKEGPVLPYTSQLDEDTLESSQNTVIQLTENFRLNPDLGEFVSTIYARRFKPQKVQSRKLALSLSKVQQMDSQKFEFGTDASTFVKARTFLQSLSEVMLREPQSTLEPPKYQKDVPITGELASTAGLDLSHQPISLSLIRLKTWSSSAAQFGYETHVHGEAALAASLVAAIQFCCPEDDIFVATPHRVQREAVKTALARIKGSEEALEKDFENLFVSDGPEGKKRGNVTVDTVERLQVKKGYLQDQFVKTLVPRAHLQPARPPLINIGTYVRSQGIDVLVEEWLQLARQSGQKAQIVSLGAGSDTRFWRIETGQYKDDLAAYIEVDFPEVTSKKTMAIRKSKEMNALLGDPSKIQIVGGGTGLQSTKYHLLPGDLRKPPSEALEPALTAKGSTEGEAILSPSLPTLIIFECVLAYMSPEGSSQLLQWFVNYAGEGFIWKSDGHEFESEKPAIYLLEGILTCCKARNVTLPGAEPFNTLESLSERLTNVGFTAARALTLKEIRRAYVDESELNRISKLELLDETEELDLLLDHYAISWGLYLSNLTSSATWGQWGLKQKRA
ncbi:hypothetical protein EST38_g889 [Candolleomyces aberdarensis]|uniref:Leucine carboxyl methyltransferase 1 n=1 Tax=Candolleomyces aberdarensis TaxID=2316362 RepID=A0A4V1Q5B1_9AGAR|nr:hypothetical protein EST38_g889 [Candolleomyces aberdarensis]